LIYGLDDLRNSILYADLWQFLVRFQSRFTGDSHRVSKKWTLKRFLKEIREKGAYFRNEAHRDRLAGFLSLKNPSPRSHESVGTHPRLQVISEKISHQIFACSTLICPQTDAVSHLFGSFRTAGDLAAGLQALIKI